MIDYVEVRNHALELIGLIDTAKSVIWETQYFGVGQFEVYVTATPETVALLKNGNFVNRVDADGIGIIESVEIVFNAQDGRMITASGRLAKSILDRRLISYVNDNANEATVFSGNVEKCARNLVQYNAIACYKDKLGTIPYKARNFPILELGALAGLSATTESRQTNYDNLLTYTDEFLQLHQYGARVSFNGKKLAYSVYSGKDCTIGNSEGNQPVIFSEDFDNLIGSKYSFDETPSKTFALVGGEGEGAERFFVECNAELSGLDRREAWINKEDIKRTIYKDEFRGSSGSSNIAKDVFYGNGETDSETGAVVGDSAFTLSRTAKEIVSATVAGVTVRTTLRTDTNQVYFGFVPHKEAKIIVQYTTDEAGEAFYTLSHSATDILSATIDGKEIAHSFYPESNQIEFFVAPESGQSVVVQYIDNDEYEAQLKQAGDQELAKLISVEDFTGSIDLTNSSFTYGVDFGIGDVVTIQDNYIDKYINVRITTVTEVQSDDGYQVEIDFEAVS